MATLPLPPPAAEVRIERAIAPIAFPDPALERVLRRQLFPPGSPPGACARQGGTRYVFNRFDLDGDRHPETLVALLGQKRCNRLGCPLMILKSTGDELMPLQTIAGFQHTLVVSDRRTHGWLDLILPRADSEGGAPPWVLTHDGAGYPGLSAGEPAEPPPPPGRGVAALVLKSSPYLVQGHPLPCPRAQRLE